MIGGYLIAEEFEHGTILNTGSSHIPFMLILAAKITRLLITGCSLARSLHYLGGHHWRVGKFNTGGVLDHSAAGVDCWMYWAISWAADPKQFTFIFNRAGQCFWLLAVGSGFGLAAGFSTVFERISRADPQYAYHRDAVPLFLLWAERLRPTQMRPCCSWLAYCLVLFVLVFGLSQHVLRWRSKHEAIMDTVQNRI